MKFSTRDLLLVTVIVALAVGWGLDHWRQKLAFEQVQESQRQSEEYLEDVLKLVEGMGLSHSIKPPKR